MTFKRMDALTHRFKCLSLLTIALALAGCQSPPKKQTATDFDAMGQMAFDAAMAGQPDPSSIVREGDHVTYVVMSIEGNNIRHLVRFDADCHLPDAQMAHLTTAGMMRFAVDRRSDTSEARQMPAEQKKLFLQSAQLKQVCTQVPAPQWRVISAPDHQDWQLIDRASLMQKDQQTLFWSARVPAAEALMPRNDGLYVQARQRWSADCAQQRLTALSTFYLDKQNRVIGGAMIQQPVAQKTLGADDRQLLTLACGTQTSLDQYKPFEGRHQTSFVLPEPQLPASVVKAIDALQLPAPEKSIQHLRLYFKDFNEASEQKKANESGLSYVYQSDAKRRELGRMGSDITYLPYEPGKQLTERVNAQSRQRVTISFRGLTELAEVEYTNEHDLIRVKENVITDLKFQGDWATMTVGTRLSYTVQRSSPRYKKAPVLVDRKMECNVDSQKPASEFYSSLSGTAKVISCTGEDYHNGQNTSIYAYLQTYGMFVRVDLGRTGGYGQFKIERAE